MQQISCAQCGRSVAIAAGSEAGGVAGGVAGSAGTCPSCGFVVRPPSSVASSVASSMSTAVPVGASVPGGAGAAVCAQCGRRLSSGSAACASCGYAAPDGARAIADATTRPVILPSASAESLPPAADSPPTMPMLPTTPLAPSAERTEVLPLPPSAAAPVSALVPTLVSAPSAPAARPDAVADVPPGAPVVPPRPRRALTVVATIALIVLVLAVAVLAVLAGTGTLKLGAPAAPTATSTATVPATPLAPVGFTVYSAPGYFQMDVPSDWGTVPLPTAADRPLNVDFTDSTGDNFNVLAVSASEVASPQAADDAALTHLAGGNTITKGPSGTGAIGGATWARESASMTVPNLGPRQVVVQATTHGALMYIIVYYASPATFQLTDAGSFQQMLVSFAFAN